MTANKAGNWTIQYRYPGTVNGEPVGIVYALNVHHISPGVWSYSLDPRDASHFATQEEAEMEISIHRWPEAKAIQSV